jgi:hypothetical protein
MVSASWIAKRLCVDLSATVRSLAVYAARDDTLFFVSKRGYPKNTLRRFRLNG